MLVEKEAVKNRWAEYIEGLLNVEEDIEAFMDLGKIYNRIDKDG